MALVTQPIRESGDRDGHGGVADGRGSGVERGEAESPADAAADWTVHAMCDGKTELFFARPGERDGRRNRREALARSYCACCSVAAICKVAGRMGREHGIWGGENDEERAAAGFSPRSPHRRAVAAAARQARYRQSQDGDDGTVEDEVTVQIEGRRVASSRPQDAA